MVLHYIGSSMLIVLISYIIVDVLGCRELRVKGLCGRVILLIVLFLGLLRT